MSFVGVPVSLYGGLRLNTPTMRALGLCAAACHGAAIGLYTDSWWLALAATPLAWLMPPRPNVVRRFGFHATWLIPGSVGLSLAIALMGGRPSADWWVLGPVTLFAVFLSSGAVGLGRRMRDEAPDRWEVAVGDSVPEVDLPIRWGGNFRLALNEAGASAGRPTLHCAR